MPLFVTRPKRQNEHRPEVELHDFIRLSKNEKIVAPLGSKQAHHQSSPLAPRATIPQTKRPVQPVAPRRPAPIQNFPPAQPAPTQPPKETAPPSPQTAAEHFRRLNKNLPDGVMYEPLDKETLELLKSQAPPQKVVPPNNSPPEPPATVTPPSSATIAPTDIADTLETLAQDERNAFVFYSHFAKIGDKKNLDTLAQDSETRMNNYIQMLKVGFSRDFTPKETDINVNIPLLDAINLAITEEHKGLIKLSQLLDKTANTSLEKQIQNALQKKIISQQVLFTCVILP